jgi:hypothetical protein
MLNWFVFAAIGKLVVYLWQLFPLPESNKQEKYIVRFVHKLHECDLCSGTWIFSILALFLGVDLVSINFGIEPSIVGKILTGMFTSYVVHIFFIGLKSKYEVVII